MGGYCLQECTYRKILCNSGHATRAFSADEMLPRRCPVCGQPYDRRFNRPIACYEDGSVPGESVDQESNFRKSVDREPVDREPRGPETPVEPAGGALRRGRQLKQDGPEEQPEAVFKRRLVNLAAMEPVGREMPEEIPGINFITPASSGSGIVLYTGGQKLSIPSEGGYLGREELGSSCFLMNPLVSRRHAYVRADRFGKLEVRDEASLNGTFVDDGKGRRQLKPGETVQLTAGNTLWIANQILAVEEDQ